MGEAPHLVERVEEGPEELAPVVVVPDHLVAVARAEELRGARFDTSKYQVVGTIEALVTAGTSIIGGCCGTGPAHIEAMAAALRRGDGVPVKLVGVGESLDALMPFDPDNFVSSLLEES